MDTQNTHGSLCDSRWCSVARATWSNLSELTLLTIAMNLPTLPDAVLETMQPLDVSLWLQDRID